MKIYYNRHYSSRPYTDLRADDPFWESFRLDSFATSNAVLSWRDALVATG